VDAEGGEGVFHRAGDAGGGDDGAPPSQRAWAQGSESVWKD
jgi:hypothetical protein